MEENKKTFGFGLCLSGGGFRATLFHLGVVKFLRDADVLKEITHIFSVSGGSVLAAHLVLNWQSYNGNEDDFEKMAEQVIELTRSDVRGKIIRKWILSWLCIILRPIFRLFRRFNLIKKFDWRITNLLDGIYSKFYCYKDEQGRWMPATLANLNEKSSDTDSLPELHILSTSVTTGRLCSFDKSGFSFTNGIDKPVKIETTRFPVSTAVAASSAFPPVFSPVAITREMIQADENDFPNTEYLTDGGVYDNLGIRKLFLLQAEEDKLEFDKIFLSDAGTAFDSKFNQPFSFILTLSIRASNLLMMRVGNLEYMGLKKIKPDEKPKVAICRIQDEIKQSEHSLDIDTQRGLEAIRTDLNTFNSWEVNILTQHGYATARKAYSNIISDTDNLQVLKKKPWIPKATKDDWNPSFDLTKQMKSARRRKWGLLSIRDYNSWLSIGIIIFFITPIWLIPYFYRKQSTEKVQLQTEKVQLQKNLELSEKNTTIAVDTLVKNSITEDEVNFANTPTGTSTNISTNTSTFLAIGEIFSFGKYKQSVVKLKVTTDTTQTPSIGSGFLVHQSGYILTADYVIGESKKSDEYIVELADGMQIPAKFVHKDTSKHLALLKIEGSNYQPLKFKKGEVANETSVIIIGYLGGTTVSLEPGIVKGISDSFLQIKFNKDQQTRTRSPGLGGGPVLDISGNVVGIYYIYQQPFRGCILASEAENYVLEQLTKQGITIN